MGRICDVKREVSVPAPQPHVASMVRAAYLGKGLRRWEELTDQSAGDWANAIRQRFSDDNGKTWSDWELLHDAWPTQGDCSCEVMPFCSCYDPVAGKTIRMVFQRMIFGDPHKAFEDSWKGDRRYYDHGLYELSHDDGRGWSALRQMKYEDGPAFDPEKWAVDGFLKTNQMYGGYNVAALPNGTVIYPATIPAPYHDEEDARLTAHIPNLTEAGCVAGVICFIGRWNTATADYDWRTSSPIILPKHVSTRGLLEPVIAELNNGDILLDMRGSNWLMDPETTPGRRWIAVSSDGGQSWSEARELRFDTGEAFYSPSSHSRMVRGTKTGKLYWVGNISPTPVSGNLPRYPLVIAEVDEAHVALKRDTLTVIDDRDPENDSEHLQLSNFSLLEDRETFNLEIYLTRIGQKGAGADTWDADALKYTLTF